LRPSGKLLSPGDRIMRFDVGVNPSTPDQSAVLTATTPLRPLPTIDLSQVAERRTLAFERTNGAWVINGKFFDPDKPLFQVREGSAEIWRLVNTSGNWWHPIHIHFEEGRILSRNGKAPPVHERGRKDTYLLRQGEYVDVYMRFRDCLGKYPIHCHNTSHEDHAMMARWDIV
jgi:FtsP/CotA-like multicopper oxidase with cupredoxin domain